MKPSKLLGRLCLCAATLALAIVSPELVVPSQHGSALAQANSAAEKEAFEAAKELGTVEAWDAFLSNYSTGFHADLARAYVKKLADQPQAPSPSATPPSAAGTNDFPTEAGSWGGIVRDGPGQNYRKVDSLDEGAPVTLLGRSDVFENGYPWFKISYAGGGSGYQWGGILCSVRAERQDLYKTCTSAAERAEQKAAAPGICRGNGGEWGDGQCWPKGHYSQQREQQTSKKTPVNKTGLSCKELKARCSRTDTNADCDRYLNSCTGHGDN